MKSLNLPLSLLAFCAAAMLATNAQAARYSTADAGGGDTEFRESQGTTARGTGGEIASRVSSNRNSVIFLKFGVGALSANELANDITVRTTYRNTNLSGGRFEDGVDPMNPGPNTGYDYYVLDPTLAEADWDESTITPEFAHNNGLGYVFDGLYTTANTGTPGSPSPGLTYLGTTLFDSAQIDNGGHLPVGGAFDLVASVGSPLHGAITSAQGTGHQTVTVAMAIAHDNTNGNGNWLNFNYLFNPKEFTTLNNDAHSQHGGADNSTGYFAPALITIPEPTSLALLTLGSLALIGRRR